MSWKRVKRVVDKAIGMDIFHLEEDRSGAEHKLQIVIGHDSCPLCGHVVPKDNLGQIDPAAHERAELAALETSHANMDKYIARTGATVKKRR